MLVKKTLFHLVKGIKVTEQHHLKVALSKLFPGRGIVSPISGRYLEFDFWIPELLLAFEFQDQYHYTTTFYSQLPLDRIKQTDEIKQKKLEDKGATVIAIPCWWSGDLDILRSTIHGRKPELFSEHSNYPRLSSVPPEGFFKVGEVPGIGELTHPSFPVSPLKSPPFFKLSFLSHSQRGWWVSEKYDGVRACWNPDHNQLYSWRGRVYSIPVPSLSNALTHVGPCLDGEIWFGRGTFSESQDFARGSQSRSLDWSSLRFIVFDIPSPSDNSASPSYSHPPSHLNFEERCDYLLQTIPLHHPFIQVSQNLLGTSKEHIQDILGDILGTMGEGLIIREPCQPYLHGRSELVLKLKRHTREEEGFVSDENNGIYTLELLHGATITAELEDTLFHSINENQETTIVYEDERRIPRIGDVVTFTWTASASRTSGIILRVRDDIPWGDLSRSAPQTEASGAWSLQPSQRRPMGYWTLDSNKNMREFMEAISRKSGCDPLVATNWYNKNKSFLLNEPAGVTLLNHYKGSFKRAVMDLFPEIGLKEYLFENASKGYWKDHTSVKQFFYLYAEKHGFDPLCDENWYKVRAQDILKMNGGYSIIRKYNGATTQALLSVFPHLDPSKFAKVSGGFWQSASNMRIFFDKFASKAKFDSLDPEPWYTMGYIALGQEKKRFSILRNYGTIYKALSAAYPDVKFDPRRFQPNTYWDDPENIKQFFDEFAAKRNFDPLLPSNWYNVKLVEILNQLKGEFLNTKIHLNTISALVTAYPNVSFNATLLSKMQHKITSV